MHSSPITLPSSCIVRKEKGGLIHLAQMTVCYIFYSEFHPVHLRGILSMLTLKRIAQQSLHFLIPRVPIVHPPTIRLASVHSGVRFSLVSAGISWRQLLAGNSSSRELSQVSLLRLTLADPRDGFSGTISSHLCLGQYLWMCH